MRAPVFLCPCTSIGTSPLQPVLPPPPAGSFPLQPALLRRSWPSFDPFPVFCGLSVPLPSPCSFRALSVLSPCPPPDSFEGWQTSSAGLRRDACARVVDISAVVLLFPEPRQCGFPWSALPVSMRGEEPSPSFSARARLPHIGLPPRFCQSEHAVLSIYIGILG